MPETHQNPPILTEIERLKLRIKKLEEDAVERSKEAADIRQRENECTRRENRLDEQEDDLFRESDRLRAKARRRERDAMEKAAHNTRVQAVKALAAMLPAAKSQAKKGKPALLRLILRATR
jgi:hypothetical protein